MSDKEKKLKNEPQADKVTNQKRLFKKKRAGEVLTEQEIRGIKEGRKKLKKEMKKKKVYSRREFELTASSMGLYFDKHRGLGLLLWLFHGRGLASLLGAIAALLAVMYLFSLVSQRSGNFTVNLIDGMFRDGYVLSEDKTFNAASSHLYSEKVENVPCVSISSLPEDLDDYDGDHSSGTYFAYTFYIKYEGDEGSVSSYEYDVTINSESQNVSDAIWLMLFEDGNMTFYAEESEDGRVEALPAFSDNTRGYRNLPLMDQTANQKEQYEVVGSNGSDSFYRVLPKAFESETIMARGQQENVQIGDIHKYTVVLWLEGDDPQCTDALIGGHIGIEMNFRLLDSTAGSGQGKDTWKDSIQSIWESLTFWD